MEDDHPLESRPPTTGDLIQLCRLLNAESARYVVIGGMSIIHHGFVRTTEDIDILVQSDEENLGRVRRALMNLPDGAAKELALSDFVSYQVVRVADEFVVDVLLTACGMTYHDAVSGIEYHEYGGVRIPFASRNLMIRLKRTLRQKDALDLAFLMRSEHPDAGRR
jgi:hypothetical protein